MKVVKDEQIKVLQNLIKHCSDIEYGNKNNFSHIKSYSDFKRSIPINNYGDLEPYIQRMKAGEANLLWPGQISDFAVSSGTSGKGKHIPLSKERIKSDQKFMRRVVLNYLTQSPNIFSLMGSHVSLPGNIETISTNPDVRLGEISAFLALESPSYLSMFQILRPEVMIKEKWAEKFELCLDKAIKCDVRQITAVPSWALRFFLRALEKTGKDSIREVWPNLKLLISGGEDIKIYLDHFDHLCRGLNMDYVENYGASEGYFAFSDDLTRNDLRLTVDNGLFYEWIPNPHKDPDEMVKQEAIPTWEAKTGTPYGMVLTNNSGLWRYCVNDIIEFTDVSRPRITVLGRTSEMLDRFGEALDGHQAETALEETAQLMDASFSSFVVGGILEKNENTPVHVWFVQWLKKPDNMEGFIAELDQNIRANNRHYAIRSENKTIAQLKMYDLDQDILHRWKSENLPTGAQTKVPRIITDDDKIKSLIQLCEQTDKIPSD
ncbi:MAG: GH3 auxin-responsive promoter family protein [Balneolales bacterium]